MKEHLQELKAGGRPKRKWEIELEEKQQEIERLNNIIKYLKKYLYEHEEYEMTILMHQLENSNIEWFERALREDSDKE